jgi:hypothetical protein
MDFKRVVYVPAGHTGEIQLEGDTFYYFDCETVDHIVVEDLDDSPAPMIVRSKPPANPESGPAA